MSDLEIFNLIGIPEAEQVEKMLALLDRMEAGHAVEVITGPGWDGLLKALQVNRQGSFDWQPLEKEATRWTAALVRLESGSAADTIGGFMTRDHQRCDDLYVALENAASGENVALASHLCNRFLVSMAHHFSMEEAGLFPAFEEKTGMRQGPTMVMRMEHEQMRNLMQQMLRDVQQGDMEGLQKTGGTLLFLMQQHNVKEEQMLYPMAGGHLSAETTALIFKMQTL